MTLTELMVAMAILATALAAILTVLSTTQRGVEDQVDLVERQTRARLAMQTLDHELRSARSWAVDTGGQQVSMLTLTNSDSRGGTPGEGVCSQFKIEGESLWTRYWIPPSDPSETVAWREVVSGVTTTSDAFVIATEPEYDGRVMRVALTLEGEGRAGGEDTAQTITGDNVDAANPNLCDEAGEQPSD